ncbi:hypothetical protein GA0070607_1610 [Micromonospora coriariae]|uniref:LPXTG-motif cell wall anchor domain-containing protein n=1 Tax=Micromonospora coriariae TaxID=285665 RepID=A0A1C4V5C7_9ACTN|nr:hypothetical protein [Micromonospora coriariae]SCE79011.1 hypothetical protein GA0070607_1610 [Micromonospora coriariae]
MTVRRRAARLATVCGLVGGLVMLGASPALADDDSVRVGAASSFAAGGSPQGVNVAVRKRSDGCVLLRSALGLRLSGLEPDQVRVQVNAGGRWFPVPLTGGGGSVATAQTSPTKPTLCKGKGITVRYRVAFTAGAPAGRLAVTGVALTATGHELGRGSDSSRLTSRASASPTPSKKPSPTPSATTEAAPADDAVNQAVVGGVSGAPDTTATAAESSGGSPVMFFGIAMVAVGLLLIVLLFRRSRQDRKPADGLSGPLPGNPGGTTYRSGSGPLAAPGQPGPVYGQQAPSGGYTAVPAPRPATGGVYGARPAGPPSPPDATQAMPGTPDGRPGPGDPPAAAGGDHTVIMPRLPG